MKLEARMKQMKMDEIDVKEKVIRQVSNKRKSNRVKTVLIAVACIFLMISVVYAATEIFINEDGTYTIQSEEKQWIRSNRVEDNDFVTKKYSELWDLINDMSEEDDKEYLGYYFSEEINQPFIVYSNYYLSFNVDEAEMLKEKYDNEWVDVVFENIPEGYEFAYASTQENYSREYIIEWFKKASKNAVKEELYVEEPTEEKELYMAQLSFRNYHETYSDKLTASIVLDSSYCSSTNDIVTSEVIEINGYQAVYSELTNDSVDIALEFKGNLIGLHGRVKENPKETMIEFISSIIDDLE